MANWLSNIFGNGKKEAATSYGGGPTIAPEKETLQSFVRSWKHTDDYAAAVQEGLWELDKARQEGELSAKEEADISAPSKYSPAYKAFQKRQEKKKASVIPKPKSTPKPKPKPKSPGADMTIGNILKGNIKRASGGKIKKNYANGGTIRKPRRA